MPTYEYECQHCHERVEAVQKFSDAALTVCPRCGGELRKVFSAVGIVFKGSGFYKNDSRPASKRKEHLDDGLGVHRDHATRSLAPRRPRQRHAKPTSHGRGLGARDSDIRPIARV